MFWNLPTLIRNGLSTLFFGEFYLRKVYVLTVTDVSINKQKNLAIVLSVSVSRNHVNVENKKLLLLQ